MLVLLLEMEGDDADVSLPEFDIQLLLSDVVVVAVDVLLACCCQRVVDAIWIARCQDATSKCLIASEVASEMINQIPMMLLSRWWL